ncbi:MAG: tetratricopeptide repeat protein [Phaeodactylibacter sp.]|nr:tetratricopeptide repeat protein [Phaeodactylibacter sp.]
MRNITFIIVFSLLLLAAFLIPRQAEVAQRADYEYYLNEEHLQKERQELSSRAGFWEKKLEAAPGNFVFQKKLAGLYANGFKLSADIHLLHRSDSLLQEINTRMPGQVGVLQALAANAITRHAFREAESHLREAVEIGANKFTSSLMLADVAMERGNLLEAELLLKDIASDAHFDYLIREVKLHDQSDNLDEAVRTMEKAAGLARVSGDDGILYWALSNLGDMYGHQGKVRKSYETYLEALSHYPAGLHALKGIAWIAFSHDGNTEEAKTILSFLQSVHPAPDYHLMLAEIAAYEGDSAAEQKSKERFIREASRKVYGNMYQSYLCLLKSEGGAAAEALAIAREEVRERPHPMSYHLLAWSSFQTGDKEQALEILEHHVLGKTGEPEALYHAGIILGSSGRKEAARRQLRAAREASFELGPVAAEEIDRRLEQL